MFRWLQSKMRQSAAESEASGSAPDDREFAAAPWSVRIDSGFDLCMTSGRDSGRAVPLDQAFALLGRAKSLRTFRQGWVDIVDATVSRRQAVLEWDPINRCYALHHLPGATNVTRVDGRAASRLDLRAGASISFGIVTAEVRRRTDGPVLSTFVEDMLVRVASKARYDQLHSEDLALTVISEEGQGNTWILHRGVYPLSAHADGRLDDVVGLGSPQDEVGLLFWTDEGSYRILGNSAAPGAIRLYKGYEEGKRPDRMFAPPRAAALEVDDLQAHALHPGDVIELGQHRLRLHAYGRPLVEACVRHAIGGRPPEELPALDALLVGVAPVTSSGESEEAPSDFLDMPAAHPAPARPAAGSPPRPFMPFAGGGSAPAPPVPGGGFGAPAPPRVPGSFGASAAPPPVPGGASAPPPPRVPAGFGGPAPLPGAAPPPSPADTEEEADFQRPYNPNEAASRPRASRPRREGDEPLQAGPPPRPPSAGRTPRAARPSYGGRDDAQETETPS